MKRFRIKSDQGEIVGKCDKLCECVGVLRLKDMGLNSYMIEDLEEDMELDADEVITAYDEGETPNDLYFF